MPALAIELIEEELDAGGSSASAYKKFRVEQAANAAQARGAILRVTPAQLPIDDPSSLFLNRTSTKVRLLDGDAATGLFAYEGTCTYGGPPTPADLGGGDVSTFETEFDTGGGTQTIKYVQLEHQTAYGLEPGNSPLVYGAINCNSDLRPQGVDIVVPKLRLRIAGRRPSSWLTKPRLREIHRLTGTTNKLIWYSAFDPGEGLFLGARFRRQGGGAWECSYEFDLAPNRSNIKIGNIAGINKGGHEYLWVFERETVENNVLVRAEPFAVYVAKVYGEPQDWAGLELAGIA